MGYKFDKKKLKPAVSGEQTGSDPAYLASLPNSLIMRVMQDPAAEKEADRLSRGVTAQTPDGLMAEMGSRLGADFSDVRFHSDTASMNRSKALGARAWAQGSDVHFGKGGFDPKIAAHELVHTVQQGAVQGNVSQSVPNGSVQLFRGENENDVRRRAVPANASNLALMSEQKDSSIYGQRVFGDLKDPVKKLAQKSGSRIRNVSEDSGINFLYNLGERDYSGKEILRDIASREVINKDDQYDRTDEYEGFLSYMQGRTDKVGLEAASLQAGILNGQPRYQHNLNENVNKRAYEMTEAELANDTFNPTNDTEVAQVLDRIEHAQGPQEAYRMFLEYTEGRQYPIAEFNRRSRWVNFAQQPVPYLKNAQGQDVDLTEGQANQYKRNFETVTQRINALTVIADGAKDMGNRMPKDSQLRERFKKRYIDAMGKLRQAKEEKRQMGVLQYRHKSGNNVDINTDLLKVKLKNMVRQVRDYPELKHKIGALNIQWNQSEGAFREDTSENTMAVSTNMGAREPTTIHYDAWMDRATPEGQRLRDMINKNVSIGNLNKAGNHELGHILESTLNNTQEKYDKSETSNDILQSVLPKVMTQQELSQVNYNAEDGVNKYKKAIYQGQIDTTSPIFKTKKMTSPYGQSKPGEWFAEAFHDVYTRGAGAKETSKEIVKEYEKRQIAQQKRTFQKKQRGFLSNLFVKTRRWFSKMWNYGARPGAQGQAQNANPAAAVPQLNAANVNPGPDAALPPVNNAVNANVDPIAAVPPVNDPLYANAVGNNDPLQLDEANAGGNEVNQADANQAANVNPIAQIVNANPEDVLNTSMIAIAPKKRNFKKKKKKKK